jgi:hypothetical protein
VANQDTDTAEGILTVGMSKGVVASSSVPPQQAPQPQQQKRLKVYQCIYIYIFLFVSLCVRKLIILVLASSHLGVVVVVEVVPE